MRIILYSCILICAWLCSAWLSDEGATKERALSKLSEYAFFKGKLSDLEPAEQVYPYTLNTPLFSDYALKERFLYLPADSSLGWQDQEVFDMPIGTILIKNFFYYLDERNPSLGRRLVETRLLKYTEKGWLAWPYWWNEAQTEAEYKVLGGKEDIEFIDAQGKTRNIRYESPNQFQCKSCHSFNGDLRPIGPSARQLHGEHNSVASDWVEAGILVGAPSDRSTWPVMDWQAKGVSLEQSARAYLDVNCGFCHRHEGPASTSGLMLAHHYPTGAATGIRKSPVAAGKGSGGRKFDILPGDAEASILYFRMQSNEPAIRMPELGRTVAHTEALELIKAWIDEME